MTMDISLNTKIRLLLIITIAAIIFGCIGLGGARPAFPDGPITIFAGGSGAVIGYLLVLSLVVLAIAYPLSGKLLAHIMPLAIPAGLSVWAMASGGFNQLLLDNLTVESRSSIFKQLAGETFIWFIPVIAAFFACQYLAKRTGKDLSIPTPPDVEVKKVKPTDQLLGLAVSVVLAYIILKLTARVPSAIVLEGRNALLFTPALHTAQSVFAVGISFFVGALAAQQFIKCSLWPLLFGPLIIAVYNYLAVSRTAVLAASENVSPLLMPSGTELAMILPIQYIAIGSLTIFWGYWYSIQLQLTKHYNLYEIELTPDSRPPTPQAN